MVGKIDILGELKKFREPVNENDIVLELVKSQNLRFTDIKVVQEKVRKALDNVVNRGLVHKARRKYVIVAAPKKPKRAPRKKLVDAIGLTTMEHTRTRKSISMVSDPLRKVKPRKPMKAKRNKPVARNANLKKVHLTMSLLQDLLEKQKQGEKPLVTYMGPTDTYDSNDDDDDDNDDDDNSVDMTTDYE